NVQVEDTGPDWVQLRLDCSKGSFVRSWAAQLGAALGVGGVVEDLRRLRVGNFSVDSALTLEALTELEGQFGTAFVPMSRALPEWKALIATPKDARLMSNGQVSRDMVNRLVFEQKQAFERQSPVFVKVVTMTGELLAILAAEPGQGLKIRRVFRTFA